MANTAKQVLTGTNGKLFIDGEEIGTWQSVSLTITINYEDVIIGSDVDRKEVSRTGEGSISRQMTNSLDARLYNKLKNQKDLRFEIETEITSDATGESQIITVPGVSFDAFNLLNMEKGSLATSEMSFRFPASKIQMPQLID